MRRRTAILALAVLSGCLAAVWGQEPPAPDRATRKQSDDRAVVALAAQLDIEKVLLEDDIRRYRDLSRRRGRTIARLADLYDALDAAVVADEAAARERSATLLDQVEEVEAERARLLAAQRLLVERLLERGRRMGLLDQQLAELEGRREERVGVLDGTWDVVLMPLELRGTFSLTQSGTLVSGTYELRGGWDGSLQGTLVNRKVYLVRIDSKLGRSMELEGFLAADGRTIRGTWLNYELAGAEGGSGQWTAKKR